MKTDKTEAQRFWEKVLVRGPDECWEWQASKFDTGYGAFVMASGKLRHASRAAWLIERGPIPDGQVVMHTCDNRLCVNLAHLRLGTCADNSADMAGKGRASQGQSHWTNQRPDARLRGSQIGTSTLNETQVASIKIHYAEAIRLYGAAPWGILSGMAQHFNTTKNNVLDIVRGKSWAHVPAAGPLNMEYLKSFGETCRKATGTRPARITAEVKAKLLAEYVPGDRKSISTLAEKYGISWHGVQRIVRGKA